MTRLRRPETVRFSAAGRRPETVRPSATGRRADVNRRSGGAPAAAAADRFKPPADDVSAAATLLG